jgi:hypothetical protein
MKILWSHILQNIMAKDGNDLTALNIALRQKVKPCASFLLTRQWSKVSVGKFGAITRLVSSSFEPNLHCHNEQL